MRRVVKSGARRAAACAMQARIDPGARAMNDIGGDAELEARLNTLRVEHRDLDDAIAALGEGGTADQLQMMRLKKRKLRLRDEIAMLEDQIIPDIIA